MALASPQPRVLADVVPHTWVRQAILVTGGAALVGLAAQIAFYLPWNPAVPVTLQTFAVLLVGGALGSMRGAAAMTLYAILGGIGLPWFSGQSSGFGGAAFGYIIGFIVAAFIVGKLAEHGATRNFFKAVGLMVIGSIVIYAIGSSTASTSRGSGPSRPGHTESKTSSPATSSSSLPRPVSCP